MSVTSICDQNQIFYLITPYICDIHILVLSPTTCKETQHGILDTRYISKEWQWLFNIIMESEEGTKEKATESANNSIFLVFINPIYNI